VDDLTHILIKAGKNRARTNYTDATVMQPYKGYFIEGTALLVQLRLVHKRKRFGAGPL
jgi:hypothetical protein